MRVVPNLYPVFEHHEVVVSTPRHVRSFAELNEDEVDGVAIAWRERTRTAREAGFPYVHALLNEGREAGASLPHSHTQLVWFAEPPPTVLAEQAEGECALCRHVETELASGERLVLERDGLVAVAAYGGRLPYELLIAPVEHPTGSGFESELLAHLQAPARCPGYVYSFTTEASSDGATYVAELVARQGVLRP